MPLYQKEALWNGHFWVDGLPDTLGQVSAFSAIDRLLVELKQRWPSLQQITLAGFSTGGQFVQHYVAFVRHPAGIRICYVIADPGSWLWFDACQATSCLPINHWKYGIESVSTCLHDRAAGAHEHYRTAEITYLGGSDDRGSGLGSAEHILDKSCAAISQGRWRLDRGINFSRYDREALKLQAAHRLHVVAGCHHEVLCVFTSYESKRALFTLLR